MNATNRETVEAFLARGGQIQKITTPDVVRIVGERQASAVASLRTSLAAMRDDSTSEAGGAGLDSDTEESSLLDSLFVAPLSFRDRLAAARRARHAVHPCPECGDDLAFKPGQDMCPDCDARLTAKVAAMLDESEAPAAIAA